MRGSNVLQRPLWGSQLPFVYGIGNGLFQKEGT